jgi:hypothetical protein
MVRHPDEERGSRLSTSTYPQIRVGFSTPSIEPVWWNLVTYQNLTRFGRKANDVVEASFSEHYPGNPHTELRLAGLVHPVNIGSGSAMFTFNDGSRASVCEIFYQDFNLNKSHYHGEPHWNHERRFMLHDTWKKPRFELRPEYHIIPKSTYIDIMFQVGGQKRPGKRILWQPFVSR